MAWKILTRGAASMVAMDDDVLRATATRATADKPGTWTVTFPGAEAFNWKTDSAEKVVGYIRGIERAVAVNAKETGRRT